MLLVEFMTRDSFFFLMQKSNSYSFGHETEVGMADSRMGPALISVLLLPGTEELNLHLDKDLPRPWSGSVNLHNFSGNLARFGINQGFVGFGSLHFKKWTMENFQMLVVARR